jgi:hypothetical protein
MMNLLKLMMVCALVFAARAQTPENEFTGGVANGRTWQALPSEFRTGFLVGFREGIIASENDEANRVYISDSATIGQVKKGIDLFYSDPANLAIGIKDASRIFLVRLGGADAATVEALTVKARRMAALGFALPIKP